MAHEIPDPICGIPINHFPFHFGVVIPLFRSTLPLRSPVIRPCFPYHTTFLCRARHRLQVSSPLILSRFSLTPQMTAIRFVQTIRSIIHPHSNTDPFRYPLASARPLIKNKNNNNKTTRAQEQVPSVSSFSHRACSIAAHHLLEPAIKSPTTIATISVYEISFHNYILRLLSCSSDDDEWEMAKNSFSNPYRVASLLSSRVAFKFEK